LEPLPRSLSSARDAGRAAAAARRSPPDAVCGRAAGGAAPLTEAAAADARRALLAGGAAGSAARAPALRRLRSSPAGGAGAAGAATARARSRGGASQPNSAPALLPPPLEPLPPPPAPGTSAEMHCKVIPPRGPSRAARERRARRACRRGAAGGRAGARPSVEGRERRAFWAAASEPSAGESGSGGTASANSSASTSCSLRPCRPRVAGETDLGARGRVGGEREERGRDGAASADGAKDNYKHRRAPPFLARCRASAAVRATLSARALLGSLPSPFCIIAAVETRRVLAICLLAAARVRSRCLLFDGICSFSRQPPLLCRTHAA